MFFELFFHGRAYLLVNDKVNNDKIKIFEVYKIREMPLKYRAKLYGIIDVNKN